VAIITVNFGQNLQDDNDAIYRVFFTNDDAGDNAGNDYGTSGAILVDTNNVVASTFRANASGTRTITTVEAHGLEIGDCVKVEGVGGSGYNGQFVVTAVSDGTHFSYFYGSGTEVETADTGGTITHQMGGLIDNVAALVLSFAYDSNDQRGAGSDGDDAPVTAVALGLGTAQPVVATATVARTTSNSVSLVAALERNYSNP
jgi:hypothetical protein